MEQTDIFDFLEDDVTKENATEADVWDFTPRPVKFKAWDKEEKCWMNDSYVTESRGAEIQQNNSRFVFVQSTSVRDKNKREVFDGDIVAVEYYDQLIRCVILYDAEKGHYVAVDKRGKEIYTLCILASCNWKFAVVGHALEGFTI